MSRSQAACRLTALRQLMQKHQLDYYYVPGTDAHNNEYVPDWVETATQFMGTPYVWGGKTYQGLDCSALVQACMHASGLSVPRDSMPQLTAFNEAKITVRKDRH